MTGDWPVCMIDHADGEKSNNRWGNLREATANENARNQVLPKNNTSGVLGVEPAWAKGRWTARITVNKKCLHLGTFGSLEEAVEARHQAERRYFGEFAPSIREVRDVKPR